MTEFEQYLASLYPQDHLLHQAMNYSLLAGGKRIRPALLLSLVEDEKMAYPAAAALEMIHTYSLIHDDLPAMDNDDLRRGKPTNHIQFGQATAILAGDALLTDAFGLCSHYEQAGRLVSILSDCAGSKGMVYGQILDMNKDDDIQQMYIFKTARLLQAALVMGAILSKKDELLDDLWSLGENLGYFFQIQDDLLEMTSNELTMGKSLSDIQNDKGSLVAKWGLNQAKKEAEKLSQRIQIQCQQINEPKLTPIVQSIIHRTK